MTRSILILIFGLWSSIVAAEVERPLIVVPGILGSTLGDQRCEYITWGDRSSLWRFKELRLQSNGQETVREHRACGLISTVQVVGPLRVDAYVDLLASLKQMEYREGDNLFLFPYDWRQSNFDTANKLKELLDSPALAGRQIDILAHSMGGLIARIYIQELGGAKRVRRLITMGTPHRGSAKMLETLDEGWGFWRNLAAGGLGTVRETVLTFPSIYELMPSYRDCCALGPPGSAPSREISDHKLWQSMPWLPTSLKGANGTAFLQRTLGNLVRMKEITADPIPEGVRFYPLCSALFDTLLQVYWDPSSGGISHRVTGKGDGTVHIRSAANDRLETAEQQHLNMLQYLRMTRLINIWNGYCGPIVIPLNPTVGLIRRILPSELIPNVVDQDCASPGWACNSIPLLCRPECNLLFR